MLVSWQGIAARLEMPRSVKAINYALNTIGQEVAAANRAFTQAQKQVKAAKEVKKNAQRTTNKSAKV